MQLDVQMIMQMIMQSDMRLKVPGQRRAKRRRRLEGMTLVEMMIVVIIMAMIAAAVGVAVLPQMERARIQQARTDALAIRSGATAFLLNNGSECPSVEALREEGFLDNATRHEDPWDTPFAVECPERDVIVASAGPNRQMGDEDDIRTDRQ
ncbi:MAG: type II secretion system GspH family protein [Sandaracinaceae bacterium]|nr:type II secretion system GspH family protein [Sandaracinaceae bacterium]